MLFVSLVVCSLAIAAAVTDVDQCPGQSFDLQNKVQLSPCKKSPCVLKKGVKQHITMSFTPQTNMEEVKNHVTATIVGVELPFVGVDGESICSKLETEAGQKASCPLTAGTTYVYKDSFPILSFYPAVNLKVHWSLVHNKKDIICFEMPAYIK